MRGLTKLIISIHDADSRDFLLLESKKKTIEWAERSLGNQLSNVISARVAEIPLRINTVVYGDYRHTLQVVNLLRPLHKTLQFEVRLLNNLYNVAESQQVIAQLCENLGAREIGAYQRAGSSNVTRYYRTEDGFSFATKVAYPYFFGSICDNCAVKKSCFEGFYGVRIESRQGNLFVRLCIYKQSGDVVMPWRSFAASDLPKRLRGMIQSH